MSTFSSFETLLPKIPQLKNYVPNIQDYLGHLPSQGTELNVPKELLTEHIHRVNSNAVRLVQAHGLEKVVESLIAEICCQAKVRPEAFSNWLKELFLGAVAFHDFGKLNENFQRERMQQPQFVAVSNGIKHHHAGLGAYLFLHHYFLQVQQLKPEREEVKPLIGLLFDFADVIALHHSPVLGSSRWHEDTAPLRRYLELLNLQYAPDLSGILSEKESTYRAVFSSHQKKEGFPRFALLKLCFSLLTASDYLATLGYMQTGGDYTRLDTSALGILTAEQKERFYASFSSGAFPYNKDALTDTERFAGLPWELLQERTNENLNLLRKKLLAEVVRTVRQHPDAPIYYLEAPTGSGKTNLSLAVTLELLRHDARLGKVFYVFPFTTLITQTYADVKKKLDLSDADIVQLHSKAEYTERPAAGEEGSYGAHWHNHVDNLFVQYPIVLLSHVRFFDVLKSNRKDANYLLHRLANSVVILDEVQSYSPVVWDHVNYFLLHYARHFNIRVVIMSATLPKLYQLTREAQLPSVVPLVAEPSRYFQNANFAGRVRFDFGLLVDEQAKSWRVRYTSKEEEDRNAVLAELADAVATRCEIFAIENGGKAAAIVEFITKKSAAGFAKEAAEHPVLGHYELLVLSGTILEPRRREVVDSLKDENYRRRHPLILLVCTQVVEAGVDIDMDLGFKDRSLLDSDEQLAGRVNRNALRDSAPVYLFDLDAESAIYGSDLRLRIAQQLPMAEYQRLLLEKDFDTLYRKVIEQLNAKENKITDSFGAYQELVRLLNYSEIDRKFQLIDNDTASVFIPLEMNKHCFTEREKQLMHTHQVCLDTDDVVSGASVFRLYLDTIHNKTGDFIYDREARQRLQSIMSKFTISVYPKLALQIRDSQRDFSELHDTAQNYGLLYLSNPEQYYSYEEGLLPNANFAIGDFF